jgi:hypothetical protein
MADQALFAYRVELPDGSETVRTGGAERPPTFGELADYASNQGERFLGPVAMSPAVPPDAAPPLPSAVAPSSGMVPTPPPAPAATPPAAPPATLGSVARETLLPDRSFTSELPSIGLATGVGAVSGPFAPLTVPVASAVGEAGQVGLEHVMGWPPAEAGTLAERMERAGVRGLAGEAITAPARVVARLVSRAVGPTLTAAEQVAPILAQDLPAGTQAVESATPGMYRSITRLLDGPPEVLAKAQLSPEGQQTLLRAWWQRQAPGGAGGVVDAWDALGPPAQAALAGEQHAAMTTLVNSLRGADAPLEQVGHMTLGQLARTGTVPTALTAAGTAVGHPYLGAGAALATRLASSQTPRVFLSPTIAPWLAELPQAARAIATPADMALRFGGQSAATRVLP